jgi:hypothetical protein
MTLKISSVLLGLLLASTGVAIAGDEGSCRDGLPAAAEVAQLRSSGSPGVVSETRNSITFEPGTKLRITRRGNQDVIVVQPGSPAAGAYINCTCSSSGSCRPKVGGTSTTATCIADTCNGDCTTKLTAPPPPAPPG